MPQHTATLSKNTDDYAHSHTHTHNKMYQPSILRNVFGYRARAAIGSRIARCNAPTKTTCSHLNLSVQLAPATLANLGASSQSLRHSVSIHRTHTHAQTIVTLCAVHVQKRPEQMHVATRTRGMRQPDTADVDVSTDFWHTFSPPIHIQRGRELRIHGRRHRPRRRRRCRRRR